jgi:hypothetical protein
VSTWAFDGGRAAVLHSGGRVEGDSSVATHLRDSIAWRGTVDLAIPPDGTVFIDVSKDYTLHGLAAQIAGFYGIDMETDYDGSDEPEWLVRLRSAKFDPKAIY